MTIPLYTVVLRNVQKVSRFDNRGRKIAEEEKVIPITIRDLPLSTAQMYRDTETGPNPVEIFRQAPGDRRERVELAKSDRIYEKKAPKAAAPSKRSLAAETGDLAAAIS